MDTPLEVARRRGNDAVYAYLLERSPASAQLVQASRRDDLDAIERLLDAAPSLLAGLDDATRCSLLCGELGAVLARAHRELDLPYSNPPGPNFV